MAYIMSVEENFRFNETTLTFRKLYCSRILYGFENCLMDLRTISLIMFQITYQKFGSL